MSQADFRDASAPATVWRQARTQAEAQAENLPQEDQDALAREQAVALEFNGISHSALLCSPSDLEDLAYGFSMTEGIIRTADDIRGVDVLEGERGSLLQIEIASACQHQLKARRRQLAGRTGCGLCGLESLDEVRRQLPRLDAPEHSPDAAAIFQALDALRSSQPLHRLTGATHAAAWCNLQGDILAVREDVGRHNALDKLLGHMLRNDIDPRSGMVLISSRASFEMVQKAAAMGINFVVAVSAPTAYAVQIADELGVMLAAFARDRSFTLYSHPHYLNSAESRSATSP
ncbi:formate dehydrogenase accessory sulfurtransferase FdhD [Alcaligenes parafaecalis]|uniref:Sulfur carrier protein FdhD n=1 Tax=Alcaligenes parafaecalis TaxID=171260 RepID=A0ABT3VRC1_9BURK|nr:formate dehydrogenase accessory sulfurtransferase FdhD [Alcaligenes parafaecalis]MCX5466099.1 formate dehydrogenase accessory sulfurtransferase FdhD [Alcaligenes parafaecalis]